MAAVMFFWICPKGYAREQVELGSIDFDHRGLSYHIWEFEDNVFMERRRICGPAEGRRI